ncbi:MAG: hypothetical protein V4697_02710 [Patescibacteria group bacterium]
MKKNAILPLSIIIVIVVLGSYVFKPQEKPETRITSATSTSPTPIIEKKPLTPDEIIMNSTMVVVGPYDKVPELHCPEGYGAIAIAGRNDTRAWCSPLPAVIERPVYGLYGKYTTYERIDERISSEVRTCTAFTVYEGSNENISEYISKIKRGNTVNHLDKDGRLVLNIKPIQLPLEDHALLVNSTSSITLKVRSRVLEGGDADACESFVELVSVEK